MKLLIIYLSVILTFVACGQSNKSEGDSSIETQDLKGYMSVVYYVPDPMAMGGAQNITYNNKSYLIGSETPANIVQTLGTFSVGNHNISVKGTFAKETGRFPNPTAEFDVINISEIK